MSYVIFVHMPGAAGPTARALARNVGEGVPHLAFRDCIFLWCKQLAHVQMSNDSKCFPEHGMMPSASQTTSAYGIVLQVLALQVLLWENHIEQFLLNGFQHMIYTTILLGAMYEIFLQQSYQNEHNNLTTTFYPVRCVTYTSPKQQTIHNLYIDSNM